VTTDLLKEFESQIETFVLVPSDGGRFEIAVDGSLIYSKLETGRHAYPGEIAGLVRPFIEENKA
jgi:selenoprotein W-related protein